MGGCSRHGCLRLCHLARTTVDSRQSTVVDISADEVPSFLARALDILLRAGSILDQDLFSSAAGFYRGMTPLHVAAEHDNANAATALLQHGGAGEPPRYRWHLGCILLKMPAISLRTGNLWRTGHDIGSNFGSMFSELVIGNSWASLGGP